MIRNRKWQYVERALLRRTSQVQTKKKYNWSTLHNETDTWWSMVHNEKGFINFIDFEQAFDNTCYDGMWRAMLNSGIPEQHIKLLQEIYLYDICGFCMVSLYSKFCLFYFCAGWTPAGVIKPRWISECHWWAYVMGRQDIDTDQPTSIYIFRSQDHWHWTKEHQGLSEETDICFHISI